MKRWIVAVIIGNLGRLFNNPQLFYRLEDRLANSAPIRQLARTIVGFYQRGSWELKQLKDTTAGFKQLDSESLKKTEEQLAAKFKELGDEWKKRASQQKGR